MLPRVDNAGYRAAANHSNFTCCIQGAESARIQKWGQSYFLRSPDSLQIPAFEKLYPLKYSPSDLYLLYPQLGHGLKLFQQNGRRLR